MQVLVESSLGVVLPKNHIWVTTEKIIIVLRDLKVMILRALVYL